MFDKVLNMPLHSINFRRYSVTQEETEPKSKKLDIGTCKVTIPILQEFLPHFVKIQFIVFEYNGYIQFDKINILMTC